MLPLQGYKRRILLIPMMLLACTLRVMEATEYKIQGIRGQSSTLIKMSYRIGRGGHITQACFSVPHHLPHWKDWQFSICIIRGTCTLMHHSIHHMLLRLDQVPVVWS